MSDEKVDIRDIEAEPLAIQQNWYTRRRYGVRETCLWYYDAVDRAKAYEPEDGRCKSKEKVREEVEDELKHRMEETIQCVWDCPVNDPELAWRQRNHIENDELTLIAWEDSEKEFQGGRLGYDDEAKEIAEFETKRPTSCQPGVWTHYGNCVAIFGVKFPVDKLPEIMKVIEYNFGSYVAEHSFDAYRTVSADQIGRAEFGSNHINVKGEYENVLRAATLFVRVCKVLREAFATDIEERPDKWDVRGEGISHYGCW